MLVFNLMMVMSGIPPPGFSGSGTKKASEKKVRIFGPKRSADPAATWIEVDPLNDTSSIFETFKLLNLISPYAMFSTQDKPVTDN